MDKEKKKRSTTTDGKPPRPGFEDSAAPAPINPGTGQHEAYWVLSEEERAKGFVRPVRNQYRHVLCGGVTSMSKPLSETYARDPNYYGATFCTICGSHFPLMTDEGKRAFIWLDDGQGVGT